MGIVLLLPHANFDWSHSSLELIAGEHKTVTLSLSWRSFYPRMLRVPEDTTPTPSDTFPTVPSVRYVTITNHV